MIMLGIIISDSSSGYVVNKLKIGEDLLWIEFLRRLVILVEVFLDKN